MLNECPNAALCGRQLMEAMLLSQNLRELNLSIGRVKPKVLDGMMVNLSRNKLRKLFLDISGSWFGDHRVAVSVLGHLSALQGLTDLDLNMSTCTIGNECKLEMTKIVSTGMAVCMHQSESTSIPKLRLKTLRICCTGAGSINYHPDKKKANATFLSETLTYHSIGTEQSSTFAVEGSNASQQFG